ncbi:hypothetical protein CDG77_18660 [Nostoc sp. 'Peltigera membranacea cyanobiont' 213]|uniref:hypothetical protein n=1 Tax=unclassified Nostoc TaxID=2593658 RepID=UPI000B956A43|nr:MULTISPECIES: hypothetical protein [unclassified Nostoc]OYD89515.1 hypothetical protein CDG77_18660 [Nostoc sp. 'Peltigera membranacea cyanobiont' 213]
MFCKIFLYQVWVFEIDANALIEQVAALPKIMRAIIFTVSLAEIPAMLASFAPNVQFDCIIKSNVGAIDELISPTEDQGFLRKFYLI